MFNFFNFNKEIEGTGMPISKPECGRPLGVRLIGNFLYVADAYFGIIKIDLNNGINSLKVLKVLK